MMVATKNLLTHGDDNMKPNVNFKQMKVLCLLVIAALLLSACQSVIQPETAAAPAVEASQTALDPALEAAIEALVTEMMARTEVPGLALGIIVDGAPIYLKGFGVTSLDTGEPVTPQTVFQWEESSMAPTAMAVLQLVEQGKLDLDAPVKDYLPNFRLADAAYAEITVRHLLVHSSGIPDTGDTMANWETFMPEYDSGSIGRWIRSLAETGLLFAPGTGFEYSAPGYALLGAVVGAVSGQTFEEYAAENILQPLGMDSSTFLLEEVDKTLLARPHVQNADGEMVVGRALPYHRPFGGANNLFASVEDMTKLTQASLNRGILGDRRILPESAFDQMWARHTPTPFAEFPFGQVYPAHMMTDWGYGWFIGDVAGHMAPNVGGFEYGYAAQTALIPDLNMAVIGVGNGPINEEFYAGDLVSDVMGILLAHMDGVAPEPSVPVALDPDLIAKIDALVQEIMARGQVPGAALGVVKDGALVYGKGFGVTELGGDEPITPESVFSMGSIAKSFVATAVMQLVTEGKIDLDAPITAYLPDFTLAEPESQEMTIRQMLSHTSGMPDIYDWTATVQTDAGALEEHVRGLSDESLLFMPGEDWAYSDTNFNVLGDVVAKVSGVSFEEYVQTHILTPLGMEHSSFQLSEVDPAQLARPHVTDENGNTEVNAFVPYNRMYAPAAALFSNVPDMARFAMANMNHGELDGVRVLPEASYAEMWAPEAASPWAELFGPIVNYYGLGWWVGELDGRPVNGNYGAVPGYQSHMAIFMEDGIAVLVAVNLYDEETGAFYALEIGNGISTLLLGGEKAISPTPEVFVQGTALPGIMDIAAGPDGMLYVASELGRMIAVVDPDSGEIVERIGVEAGVDTPTALTVGPDGSIYWSSFYPVEVCRLSPAREKTCQAMPEDTWGLAFSADGRLFIAADAHVQTIYELDPLLQKPPQKIIHHESLLAHFAFGPDGYLYVPSMMEGTILRMDVDADPATEEVVAEGLSLPVAVAFDSAGRLFVVTSPDGVQGAIEQIDLATGGSTVVGRLPSFYTNLTVDAQDRLFVGHFIEGAISTLTADGSLEPLTPPGMGGPGGLAVSVRPDGGESVFVAGWMTLHEYDAATGAELAAWRTNWAPGAIPCPRAVAMDGDKPLVTAWGDQWGGSAVVTWDTTTASAAPGVDGFVWPANAIRFMDDLVVVDMSAETGWQVIRAGAEAPAERHALGAGVLQQPLGLAADEDNLWVTDYATGSVVQLIANGEELAEPITVVADLVQPEGIAVAPDGRLLVAETGTGRLLAVDQATGAVTVIAEGLGMTANNAKSTGSAGILPPYWIFNGVAVAPSGSVFVSGDAANVIYRISESN